VTVSGSYDPRRLGCDASEFYDDMHPSKRCLDRISFAP
jgi:hypothetical protein